MADKIPISFNEENLKTLERLEHLLGLTSIYGATPKVVKFSINFALSALEHPQKVYGGLSDDEIDMYFSSMARYEKEQRLLKQSQNLAEQAKKV